MRITLFKPGIVGLARLLIALSKAGASVGISTPTDCLKRNLLNPHSQSTICKARDLGLIDRVEGEPLGPGKFTPV